jgi:hypothetical protein
MLQVWRNSGIAAEQLLYLGDRHPVHPAFFAVAFVPVEARNLLGHAGSYAFIYTKSRPPHAHGLVAKFSLLWRVVKLVIPGRAPGPAP